MKIVNIENISIRPSERKIKKMKKITEDIISATKISTPLFKEKKIEKEIYAPITNDKFEHTQKIVQQSLNKIEK